jgi:hypothetical protein
MPICTSSIWEWLPNNDNLIVVHSVIICCEDTSLPLEVIDLTRSSSDGNGVYIESYGRICR